MARRHGEKPRKYGRRFKESKPGTCRLCGCTDEHACIDPKTGDPCSWVNVEHTLCSACGGSV